MKPRLKSVTHVAARAGCAAFLLAAGIQAAQAQQAPYTQQQVANGQQAYNAHCSQCHAADLSGQSGPALAGPQFQSSLEFSKMSAKQLYDFISTQMPYDDPGSLKKDQYLDVLAYLLSKNDYPSDNTKLTEKNLSQVQLLPYPGGNGKHASKGD